MSEPDPRIYIDHIPPAELEACQKAVCDLWARMDFPSSYEIARVVLMALRLSRDTLTADERVRTQLESQHGDDIELQEAEQRGFERGVKFAEQG